MDDKAACHYDAKHAYCGTVATQGDPELCHLQEGRGPMTSNLDPDARSSYRLITLAARMVQRRQDDALAPLGLTRAAVIALEGLSQGPLNQERLADAIRVQSQTLGRVLTRLEGDGFITRTRQTADRRQLKVELTPEGEAALEAARQAEIDAYPDDPDIGWGILREELAKFVKAAPAGRKPDVVPFVAPERRTHGQIGHERRHHDRAKHDQAGHPPPGTGGLRGLDQSQ